jgi:putative restriction endonuclease
MSSQLFIGVTDKEWFKFLSRRPQLDEVNFWQPGGRQIFRALKPGQPFLFKLHSPDNFIVGGGFFTHSTILPATMAWESFGEKNGAASWPEMRDRIAKYRRVSPGRNEDYSIGCILLTQPFFLHRDQWLPIPTDWSLNIVQGKGYDMASGPGKALWEKILMHLSGQLLTASQEPALVADSSGPRYGEPYLSKARLGQGTFRIWVTDNYQRRCAITGEKALPALEAAHIRPYGNGGEHRLDNGILLRADVHHLFDKGYVTITPDYHFEASQRLKSEFHNGEEYFALHGKPIWVPSLSTGKPNEVFLRWHNENCFKG